MENCWPKEKAQKHIGYFSLLLIVSGIATMFDSFRRFGELGESAFISPYVLNILDFLLSIFQVCVGVILRRLKNWTKWAILFIIVIRLSFDIFFDVKEFIFMAVALFYYFYIFKKEKAGWLLENN